MNRKTEGTQATWLPVYATLTGVIVVMLDRYRVVPLHWLALVLATGAAGAVAFLVTMVQADHGGGGVGWGRALLHRLAVVVGGGGWTMWLFLAGPTTWNLTVGVIGTVGLAVLGLVCQSPHVPDRPVAWEPEPARDNRHEVIRHWEGIIRRVTGWDVVVISWEPWDNPADGLRLFVELPADKGITPSDLAQRAHNLAASGRLPRGCAVRVDNHDLQGTAAVDVMLRNTLLDVEPLHVEPTTPASINDGFPILRTPRGDVLSVCLRIMGMIVGGTTGSGKTTLLHRIIMFLARCTDTLVWVIDLNGGGVAEPWINPWANGKTPKPVVDWVADSEEEAAVMVAVAVAIAKARKVDPVAARRTKDDPDNILPVAADMPGILVITDEGGEVGQTLSVIGVLVGQGLDRIAQIGRAQGVRTIMSVLRGTSDLLSKKMRTVSDIRLCLRMTEHDEYIHVLDVNPGKTELDDAKGAGFLRTPTSPRPVLGRTDRVMLLDVEEHAVATGHLRPDLDAGGLRAAAAVTPGVVTNGKYPGPAFAAHPAMQDCLIGKAYAGRWDRYARKLAEMRGEVVDYDEEEVPVDPTPPAGAGPTGPSLVSALDALEASVLGRPQVLLSSTSATPPPAPPAGPDTAREQILTLVRAAGTGGMTAGELERQVNTARSRLYALLKELREAGELEQAGGRYVAGTARPVSVG